MRILWIVLLILCPIQALASGSQSDQLSRRWASWFSGQDVQMSPKPAPTTAYQATLTPTFYTAPIAPGSLHDLVPENDRAKANGLLASTTWLKGSFSTETEVAANQSEAIGARQSRPEAADNSAARMMRLGLTGLSGRSVTGFGTG